MRLIDADELIKRIGEWMPQGPGEIKQTVEERVATDMAASMYMEIEETPTAFDKEKVIKELREELNLSDAEKERCARENPLQFDSAKGYANGIANAIEIVEKGGVE